MALSGIPLWPLAVIVAAIAFALYVHHRKARLGAIAQRLVARIRGDDSWSLDDYPAPEPEDEDRPLRGEQDGSA